MGYETIFKSNLRVHILSCIVHFRRYFEQVLNENCSMAVRALEEIEQDRVHVRRCMTVPDERKDDGCLATNIDSLCSFQCFSYLWMYVVIHNAYIYVSLNKL